MIKDEIITLEDNSMYGLLLESKMNNQNYYLAVEVDEDENPLNNFKVLKEIEENQETLVIEETDPFILNMLVNKYHQVMNSER